MTVKVCMIVAMMVTDPKAYYTTDWEGWWMEKWGLIILDWTLDMVKVTNNCNYNCKKTRKI